MSIKTVPTCNDCNEELTNFEIFLERKYPRGRGYFVCSKCQKVRDKKIIKELADSLSDLSLYDYPKTIAKYKKEEEESNLKDFEEDLTRGGTLKWN